MKPKIYAGPVGQSVSTVLLLFLVLFCSINNTFAHKNIFVDKTVKGKVVDESTGEPLAGVTVRVKGTKGGTSTQVDGTYTMTVPENSSLIFSYIGYKDDEVSVSGITTVDVKLSPLSAQLNTVVVTALNIKKERRKVGYSTTEVKGAVLTEAREDNIANGLEGRVAGVNVSGVATGPGGSANVVIRGISSITGSSQPLYVIDGIPLTNNTYRTTDVGGGYGGSDGGDGIGNINPDDVESMSILKGAAATALYGYRGANGVILITTKSGKGKRGLGVEINSNIVAESVIDNTDFQTQYGQGYGGFKPINGPDARGSGMNSWGAPLDGSLTYQFDGVQRPYSAKPGNIGRFYETALSATNTVALTKNFGEDGNIRFSASDLDDKSIIPNAGLQRQTFTFSGETNLDKHLAATLKAQYIAEQVKNSPNVSDAPGNLNFASFFLPPNVDIRDLAPGYDKNGTEVPFLDDEYTTNPYFVANKFIGNTNRNRFIGSADVKYTFDNKLYLQVRAGEDYSVDRVFNVTPQGTLYQIGGAISDQTVRSTELNVDGIVGKEFKVHDFSLDALAGVTYRRSAQEYVTVNGQNFAIPFLYTISNVKNVQTYYSNPVVVNKSLYGSLDFSYKNYAYLSVTGRNDLYSTLAPGTVNYFYPSISGSFVFSELVHIKNMDMGKIRIGYADVGGEADQPYQTLLSYNIIATMNGYGPGGGSYPLGNIANYYVPNSALRPSSEKEAEIGAELSFWKGRLTFDAAVYQKRITNSIIPATSSQTSGYPGVYLNIGNLRDNGVELLVTGAPIKTRNFTWSISANAAYNDNKILALATEQDNLLLANSRAGEDDGQQAQISQIVGMAASQIIALDPPRDKNGNVRINPVTGAPFVNKATYKPFGSGIDPWSGGITNEFTYKNFNLSFLIDGKFGGKIFSGTNYYAYQLGLSKETLVGRNQKFGSDSLYPQDYYTRMSVINSHFIYDASFIKLRQIVLKYNFPSKMFHDKIQGISLSVVARNVVTLMKHTPNIDPESNYSNTDAQGIEQSGVPYTRSYGVNLNVKF